MFVYIKENEMKKVALSLLAFAMVTAMAFGQDAPAVKIGGYLDIGTTTTMMADSGNSTVVRGDDMGVAGGGYQFKLTYGTDMAGLVTRTRVQNVATGAAPVLNPQAFYGWFYLPALPMAKVMIGNYDDDGAAWNQLDDKGDKQTKGTGVALQFNPAEGVFVGAGVVPQGAANALYSVGFGYTVPATVKLAAAVLTDRNKDGAIAAGNAAVSFKLLLDGPLSVKGGVNLYGLQQDKAVGFQIIDVTLGYKITDALSAGLNTYLYNYGSDVKSGTDSAALSYKLTPSVTYVVDAITTVAFEMTYLQGAADAVTAGGSAVAVNKIGAMNFKPNATFVIDANTKVLASYNYVMITGDLKPAKDASQSVINLELRYSF